MLVYESGEKKKRVFDKPNIRAQKMEEWEARRRASVQILAQDVERQDVAPTVLNVIFWISSKHAEIITKQDVTECGRFFLQ